MERGAHDMSTHATKFTKFFQVASKNKSQKN